MLKFSKKVEYGILAMQYMADRELELVSAKEMSEKLGISFEFLSKTLQNLMKFGLIHSVQGIKGGYQITKQPTEINLKEISEALGQKPNLVDCIDSEDGCERVDTCSIRFPLIVLQEKINYIFENTFLSELKTQNLVQIELNYSQAK